MSKGGIHIIAGIQGSGKGTISKMLSKDFGIVWVCIGDIFRWHIKNKTKVAKELLTINSGNMVTNEITNNMILNRLEMHDWDNDLILDGYPRNIEQVNFLLKNNDLRSRIKSVINIRIPDELAIERIRHRSIVSGDAARADDADTESIMKRITVFHKETEPALNAFNGFGLLHQVDNSGSIDIVYPQIKHIMGLH